MGDKAFHLTTLRSSIGRVLYVNDSDGGFVEIENQLDECHQWALRSADATTVYLASEAEKAIAGARAKLASAESLMQSAIDSLLRHEKG